MEAQEILNTYKEAWLYTNRFTTDEGDAVEFKSVCLVRHGINFHHVFNTWCQASRFVYTVVDKITIEEALALPSLPDRLSLLAKVELIGDNCQTLSHEYEMNYL